MEKVIVPSIENELLCAPEEIEYKGKPSGVRKDFVCTINSEEEIRFCGFKTKINLTLFM